MRYASIIYFIIICHVCLAMYNSLGIFEVSVAPSQDLLDAVGKEKIDKSTYSAKDIQADKNMDYGDFIKSLFMFIEYMAIGIIVIPYTIHQMGIPMGISIFVSMPIYFLYIIALIQILSKDSYRGKN